MADNSILTPGYLDIEDSNTEALDTAQYLIKDNYLSEYITDEEKAIVRDNLLIPSKESVYTKLDVDIEVSTKIRAAILEYLNMEDPHGILPIVDAKVEGMVKSDGSTPFESPQLGKDPILDSHLTTKRFVNKLLKEHISLEDPHEILPEVINMLLKYVKTSDIYSKLDLYTKAEVEKLLASYVKKDGTTPFTKALIGADPTLDSHLSTKRYVDRVIKEHLVDIDPHGFITILNLRLGSYAKKKDVFDKTETYSRTLIDNIISKIVEQSVECSLQDYVDTINDKFEYIRKLRYVKQDGSIPFTNPLQGVDAIEDCELVTLRLLLNLVQSTKQELLENIDTKECVWRTHGPIESTVGHFEDDTTVPETMTFLEVCDAVFYGKGIELIVPEYCNIAETFPITVCIKGSTGTVEEAEIWQGTEVIYTFVGEDFRDGCITVDSNPMYKDTEITFRVSYTNEAVHTEVRTVKLSMPTFVGLLPKWKFGNYITMDYLKELANTPSNEFLSLGKDVKSITFKYLFEDAELRHPFIVIPEYYPNLDTMVTKSLSFDVDAFNVINMIPLQVAGKDIIYKMYIYKQALSSLNQEVTFNFKSKE